MCAIHGEEAGIWALAVFMSRAVKRDTATCCQKSERFLEREVGDIKPKGINEKRMAPTRTHEIVIESKEPTRAAPMLPSPLTGDRFKADDDHLMRKERDGS